MGKRQKLTLDQKLRLNQKDREAFAAFRAVGKIKEDNLTSIISQNRIKTYIKQGIIERGFNTKGDTFLTLTAKGRDFAKDYYLFKNFYGSSGTKHDLKMQDKYFSLTKEVRETWKTEADLRDRLEIMASNLRSVGRQSEGDKLLEDLRNGVISTVDCTYTTEDGVEIAYEVVTYNYSAESIIAKENFATTINVTYTQERV